jgi:hypothetical protein
VCRELQRGGSVEVGNIDIYSKLTSSFIRDKLIDQEEVRLSLRKSGAAWTPVTLACGLKCTISECD